MQTQLTALAHASVLQLREAIRRVTAMHASPVAACRETKCPARAQAADPTWGAWEDTRFDVRHNHA